MFDERLCHLIDQRNRDKAVWKQWVEPPENPRQVAWCGTMEAFSVWDDATRYVLEITGASKL